MFNYFPSNVHFMLSRRGACMRNTQRGTDTEQQEYLWVEMPADSRDRIWAELDLPDSEHDPAEGEGSGEQTEEEVVGKNKNTGQLESLKQLL